MNVNEICVELLAALGGKDNVSSNEACMTRLRVGLRNPNLADVEAIRAIEGVLGVVQADTLQIVFGPGKVNKVLDAFVALTGIPKGSSASDAGDAGASNAAQLAKENKGERTARQHNPVQAFLKRVANIFVPLLPGIIAAGLINGVTNIV
ncbi:MAG: PTS transporter subunit EIIB, partial [Coriobacteriales bacterium]|nr:PTS transporter subunit EIIB [Coriobacteriales bacterium]